MGGDITGMIAVTLIFGGGTAVALMRSYVRLVEIKARSGPAVVNHGMDNNTAGELVKAVSELRQEVSSLRETSTRFDMSFDAALSRLEQRVDHIETAPTAASGTFGYVAAPASSAEEPAIVSAGRAG